MSLETYWLIIPLACIALTLPLWGWLLLMFLMGVADWLETIADEARRKADQLERGEGRRCGKEPDLFGHLPVAPPANDNPKPAIVTRRKLSKRFGKADGPPSPRRVQRPLFIVGCAEKVQK